MVNNNWGHLCNPYREHRDTNYSTDEDEENADRWELPSPLPRSNYQIPRDWIQANRDMFEDWIIINQIDPNVTNSLLMRFIATMGFSA